MFLLYPLPAFSTASLECAHYSRRGFCGGKKKSLKLLRLHKLSVEMLPPLFGCQDTTTKDKDPGPFISREWVQPSSCRNQMLLCSQLFVARKSKVIFSTD